MSVSVRTSCGPTTGSWFSSGYHGHFRSKSRNDFINEYRQIAKPTPPQRYLQRSQVNAARHVFSQHDNRQAFLNDALIFEEGLGRRRVKNTTFKAKEDLMTWIPTKKELEAAGPRSSTYQVTYYHPTPVKQLISRRPKSCFGERPTSTYRTTHGKENPFRLQLLATTREPFSESDINTNRIQRASSRYGHDTVASCLSWHHPKPPESQRRQMAPKATEICVPKTPQKVISVDIPPIGPILTPSPAATEEAE